MEVDLDLVCGLIARHLAEDGVRVAAAGPRVAIKDALIELHLRRDPNARRVRDGTALNDPLWVDVEGIAPGRTMSLDIAAWGLTPEDAAIDAAHGLIDSIIPAARWLAREPGFTPTVHDGTFIRVEDVEPGPWMCFCARPWVVAVSHEQGLDAQGVAESLRQELDETPEWVVLGAGGVIGPAMTPGEPHWVKVMATATHGAAPSGRIDIDNLWSYDATVLANAMPWPEVQATSLVRQLVAIREEEPMSRSAAVHLR